MTATLIRLRTRIWAKKDLGAFPKGASDRGVALLLALLLLVMMSALGVIMVLTVSPDMMINGYYGNYRGSFYAADSGLNIARQQLINLTQAQVNMTPCPDWENQPPPCDKPPLQSNIGPTLLTGLMSTYGGFTPLQGGQAANSWPENFEIANSSSCPYANDYRIANGYPIITHASQGVNARYVYGFNYKLCSVGRAQGAQQVATSENGTLLITIQGGTVNPGSQSYSAYGAFINNYPPCLGPLVPGTMTGKMFTNGAWQFMTGGAYIFTDPVGQANANADFWFGGTCIQSPTPKYTYRGQTIQPTFQQGLNLAQPTKPMPANDFSQEWAVLDAKGCGEGSNQCGGSPDPAQNPPPPAVTNADLNAKLRNINGSAYPLGGANSGVYIPYSCTGGPPCTNTFSPTGGGFYVKGNAAVTLSIGNDNAGNPTQIYTINQSGTVTTITTNLAANTTTVVSGGTTLNISGVPQDLANNPPGPATMLFVDGKITSLSGTGEGKDHPAIQDGVALTITANGDINITGDIRYKSQPVTADQNDTLIDGADHNQVFGLFTATGNIVLSSSYADKNLEVDGSLAAIGQNCASSSCGFKVSGCINTFNNIGGQIQANIFSACMNTQNTYFDRRYLSRSDNFAPPWFPATTVDPGSQQVVVPTVASQSQRLSWVTTPQ